jgi:hypothetical protein
MSTAAPTEPADKGKGKERRSVEKFLSRVKTVLKKGEGSKRLSFLGTKSAKKE